MAWFDVLGGIGAGGVRGLQQYQEQKRYNEERAENERRYNDLLNQQALDRAFRERQQAFTEGEAALGRKERATDRATEAERWGKTFGLQREAAQRQAEAFRQAQHMQNLRQAAGKAVQGGLTAQDPGLQGLAVQADIPLGQLDPFGVANYESGLRMKEIRAQGANQLANTRLLLGRYADPMLLQRLTLASQRVDDALRQYQIASGSMDQQAIGRAKVELMEAQKERDAIMQSLPKLSGAQTTPGEDTISGRPYAQPLPPRGTLESLGPEGGWAGAAIRGIGGWYRGLQQQRRPSGVDQQELLLNALYPDDRR